MVHTGSPALSSAVEVDKREGEGARLGHSEREVEDKREGLASGCQTTSTHTKTFQSGRQLLLY